MAGYIAALPSMLRKGMMEESFRAYVTDSLQAIGENTAVAAVYYSGGKAGKVIQSRWADYWNPTKAGEPEKEESRSPEEVIESIKKQIPALPPG